MTDPFHTAYFLIFTCWIKGMAKTDTSFQFFDLPQQLAIFAILEMLKKGVSDYSSVGSECQAVGILSAEINRSSEEYINGQK